MLRRVLVPLDGSPLAEKALPVATNVAYASDGTIVLLRVIGIAATYTPYVYGPDMVQSPSLAQELIDTEQDNAEKYLAEIASLDVLASMKVESTVIPGSAGMTILDTAKEENVDLIVMSSHGETGFKRLALGSVAQHVSRHSPVPVLVLHEDESAPASTFSDSTRPLHSITALVALDGSELAEASLEPAAYLVGALAAQGKGTLLLSMVANKPAHKDRHESEEHMRDEAKKYLIEVVERLQGSEIGKLNLGFEWCIVESKDVANALIQTAESGKTLESSYEFKGCDLIAVVTHGRGGLQRLMAGSITESILGQTTLPVLVVSPNGEKS